jgi:purine-binding chemotaxis protein CheW
MADDTLLATFTVADMWCGIDVRHVREVLLDQQLEPVPLAPTGVIGLLNLRGQVLAAIDLRARMGLPARDPGQNTIHYIVEQGDFVESVVVDSAGVVVDTQGCPRCPVPETTPAAIAPLLACAYQHDDGLLLVVRLDRVLDQSANQVR